MGQQVNAAAERRAATHARHATLALAGLTPSAAPTRPLPPNARLAPCPLPPPALQDRHLVVSYSRKRFGQSGDGHFSPVGAFHGGRGLVLVLDVARFKYGPHWVGVADLMEAMDMVDPATGGWGLLGKHITSNVVGWGRWRLARVGRVVGVRGGKRLEC